MEDLRKGITNLRKASRLHLEDSNPAIGGNPQDGSGGGGGRIH